MSKENGYKNGRSVEEASLAENAIERLTQLAEKKGAISIRDFASVVYKKMPDEEAEKVWFGVNKRGVKITGIDTRPKRRIRKEDIYQNEYEKFFIPDTISATKKTIDDNPLLTHREEISLVIKVRQGERARKKLAEAKGNAKRYTQIRKIAAEEREAVNQIVQANPALILKFARADARIRGEVLSEDSVQEGFMGLQRALKNFEWQRGFKFSTYASWWIRQAIKRAKVDTERLIPYSYHFTYELQKVLAAQDTLVVKLGRKPTKEEIAKETDLPLKKVEDAFKYRNFIEDIDAPLSAEGGKTLVDIVEDPDSSVGAVVADDESQEEIQDMLSVLTELEREVASLRGEGMTIEGITKEIGVSREVVKRTLAITKEKLKYHFGDILPEYMDSPKTVLN